MNMEYIIVQAGGKGTRLEHLTKNKPKALVPVENLPMLFHLFRQFPDKKYIIIGDYHQEVLRKYLSAFATVQYHLVEAEGTGTCSGAKKALHYIPDGKPFLFIWSDLILPKDFALPTEEGNYIGISQTFSCRWRYECGSFAENPSVEQGVAGLFGFSEKKVIEDVPLTGEFVRWISTKNLDFKELGLAGTREFGIYREYQALEQEKCRPFNKTTIENAVFTKEALDEQGEALAVLEENWYRYAMNQGISSIPKIYQFQPLKMEEIKGKTIYECSHFSLEEKRKILKKLVDILKEIHGLGEVPVDSFSMKEAYFNKTMDRLQKIRDLVPFAEEKTILINGRTCRNVFFYQKDFEKAIQALSCSKFRFLHGDCTFSNIMLREDLSPVLIDPRGYFGYTKLYGDPNYDWAKLYYSLVGNYDQFNLKGFTLDVSEKSVDIKVISSQWEELEHLFFHLSGTNPLEIKLLHSIIWLSLTTYAWHDYDSICGAFYQGLYYLEEILP